MHPHNRDVMDIDDLFLSRKWSVRDLFGLKDVLWLWSVDWTYMLGALEKGVLVKGCCNLNAYFWTIWACFWKEWNVNKARFLYFSVIWTWCEPYLEWVVFAMVESDHVVSSHFQLNHSRSRGIFLLFGHYVLRETESFDDHLTSHISHLTSQEAFATVDSVMVLTSTSLRVHPLVAETMIQLLLRLSTVHAHVRTKEIIWLCIWC